MDAARTALRLGAEVHMLYTRRSGGRASRPCRGKFIMQKKKALFFDPSDQSGGDFNR